ncbi:MAG: class I SAM-dependent methyltransferase [Chloroflexi bacterium]|nr:class I SAM-dependent methyltransferase [Chloroflexota bacterium]
MVNYNQLAGEYARHRKVHPEVLKCLMAGSSIDNTSRVLEAGCGTGNYIITLQSLTGCAAWGIDPSDQMLAKATSRASQVTFSIASAETLDQSGDNFDLIFSVDVIHHVIDRRSFFTAALRLLKSGGRVCTVTDSEEIIRNRVPLSTYFPETVEPELKRYPPTDLLRNEMQRAGFGDIEEQTVGFPYMLNDSGPFRDKAYSALHLIPQAAFERDLARLQADLSRGPIPCMSRYVLVWGANSGRE